MMTTFCVVASDMGKMYNLYRRKTYKNSSLALWQKG